MKVLDHAGIVRETGLPRAYLKRILPVSGSPGKRSSMRKSKVHLLAIHMTAGMLAALTLAPAAFALAIHTAAAQIKIACIGNSITEGTVVGGNANAYPAALQKLLGTGYLVQNDGVSSTTLLKSGDTPYWTKGKLKDAFTFQPDIITMKLGTNDTKPQNWDAHKQDFKKDCLAMIDTLGSMASHPKIWIVLPVPVIKSSYGINDTALQKIIVILKQVAMEKNLPIIDANTPLKGKAQLFMDDGVHPNQAGEDTLGHVFYRALTAAPTEIRRLASPEGKSGRMLSHRVDRFPDPAGTGVDRNASGQRLELKGI
ncbi:MAG: Alpha-L-fucosidase [Fibrobacteres bacterium]|nr:Alpha-L-fucosidase [Fibrobacterota bacterium]